MFLTVKQIQSVASADQLPIKPPGLSKSALSFQTVAVNKIGRTVLKCYLYFYLFPLLFFETPRQSIVYVRFTLIKKKNLKKPVNYIILCKSLWS